MGDVAERARVNERGRAAQRLHQVRQNGILEQQCHGALRAQLQRTHRLEAAIVTHNDAAQAVFEIRTVTGQREDGHDLGCGGDEVAILAWYAIGRAAQSYHDVTKRAIVHVDGALPGDAARVDAQLVALLQVIVQHRGQQRVRRRDRVEIAREVQVDVFHGHDLRVAATGRAALDAEHRAQAGLAQA